MAKIDDSHGAISVPTSYLSGTVLKSINTKYQMPIELTFSSENDIVVKSTKIKHLCRGDVILSIEGKPVKTIIEERKPYTIASNTNGLLRNILYDLLFSSTAQLSVEVMRNGEKKSVCIDYFQQINAKCGRRSWDKYDLTSKNIIHIDNIKSAMENRDIILNNLNSKGLIIDMREYPYEYNMEYLPQLLHTKYPLWCSRNEVQLPGCFKLIAREESNEIGHQQYPCYKEKIVILVDEHTQSAGETWTMWHRLAPNSVVVGRQTAGANGIISRLHLPGGNNISYTSEGAYYPHWEVLQRKGVKIDIRVSQSVEDIKAGRDVWIEKAIEIIEN